MPDPGMPSGDLFHFAGSLSRQARDAISRWYALNDCEDVDRAWITIETACLMVFRLKAAADDPALFPKGKWATIQILEEAVLRTVRTLI